MENSISFLVEKTKEGGYIARASREPILAEADNLDDLIDFIWDAVRCHFEENERPKLIICLYEWVIQTRSTSDHNIINII